MDYDDNSNSQPNTIRVTSPFMSKYEKAIILGRRAMQIQKNSPLYIDLPTEAFKHMNALEIA